jgi:gliding motility-associated-like protein
VESNNGVTFSPATGTNTEISYAPPALADTTYYQRVVVSSVCRDTSVTVKITVDPAVRNFGIQTLSGGEDTTVCEGVPVNALVPAGVITGGDGLYAYNWQSSTDNGNTWSGTGGTAESYHPAPLAATTLFRRVVTSGMCSVISDTVTITVLPALTNNLLPADYAVCEGMTSLVDGTTPAGGNGTYSFLWQESTDAASWSDAAGSAAGEDYQTPVLSDTVYYRRIVYSGPANTCGDTTAPLQIGIYLLPSADLSVLDTTICSGHAVDLTVQVTGDGGPWQLEYADGLGHTSTVTLTAATPSPVPVSPVADNALTDYTYTLTALTDARGCQALPASLTGQASVHVNGVPVADAGEDAEVCSMQYQLQGVQPPFGDALWIVPVSMSLTDTADARATATVTAEGTYQLTWQVTNGVCPAETDQVTLVFWQEPGEVTASRDTTLEPGSREVDLQAVWQEPRVGTLTWSTTSPAVIDDVHSEQIHVSALPVGESIFRVEVANGVCAVKADEVRVTVPDFTAHNYGISPNNDGINDKMTVAGAEHTPNTLVIFDVHGTVVFRTDNFMHADNSLTADGWEGVNNDNEPLPDGTYYYILEMKGDVQETLKGYIIIKRSTQ